VAEVALREEEHQDRGCARDAPSRQRNLGDHASIGRRALERHQHQAATHFADSRVQLRIRRPSGVGAEIPAEQRIVRDAAAEVLLDVSRDVGELHHLSHQHRVLALLSGELGGGAIAHAEQANAEDNGIAQHVAAVLREVRGVRERAIGGRERRRRPAHAIGHVADEVADDAPRRLVERQEYLVDALRPADEEEMRAVAVIAVQCVVDGRRRLQRPAGDGPFVGESRGECGQRSLPRRAIRDQVLIRVQHPAVEVGHGRAKRRPVGQQRDANRERSRGVRQNRPDETLWVLDRLELREIGSLTAGDQVPQDQERATDGEGERGKH